MNTQLLLVTKCMSPKSWRSVTRCFGTSSPPPPTVKDDTPKPVTNPSDMIALKQRVGKFGKIMLVMSGHYKKVSDVPDVVLSSQFERSTNLMRLYIGISLTILSAVMLFSQAISARNGPKLLDMKEFKD